MGATLHQIAKYLNRGAIAANLAGGGTGIAVDFGKGDGGAPTTGTVSAGVLEPDGSVLWFVASGVRGRSLVGFRRVGDRAFSSDRSMTRQPRTHR